MNRGIFKNKTPHLIKTESDNQLIYIKKTYDDKTLKLAFSKINAPSPVNNFKINQSSNKKLPFGYIKNNTNISTKENLSSKINFNTNLKNLKISYDNKNINNGEINNYKLNNYNNRTNYNINNQNNNNNNTHDSRLNNKELHFDNNLDVDLNKVSSSSNKNRKKIVITKK